MAVTKLHIHRYQMIHNNEIQIYHKFSVSYIELIIMDMGLYSSVLTCTHRYSNILSLQPFDNNLQPTNELGYRII
jgi:hypothetical protein